MRDDAYFDHHYISNSNLKQFDAMFNKVDYSEDPARLEKIFEFGHLVEDLIFQPHQAKRDNPDIERAERMAKRFRADEMCKQILWVPDLRRQHEWYREERYGVPARMKADADSKRLGLIFELKGLAVRSDSQFREAIDHFKYDMGIAWYLDVSDYKTGLIAAPSKTVDLLFKRLIDRDHSIYKNGRRKAIKLAGQIKEAFYADRGQNKLFEDYKVEATQGQEW